MCGATRKEAVSYRQKYRDIKVRKYYSERFSDSTSLQVTTQKWGGGN